MIGIKNLTNRQRGHESSSHGKIKISKLEARYSSENANKEDIADNMMLIKINKRYRNDITPFELYEATRGYWTISFERAKE